MWWEQELSVGRFKLQYLLVIQGSCQVMMCLRVCQLDRDGLPLLFHYHYPRRRLAVRALDKGLLREGMTEANPKAKFTTTFPQPPEGSTIQNTASPRSELALPPRSQGLTLTSSHFPGPRTQ